MSRSSRLPSRQLSHEDVEAVRSYRDRKKRKALRKIFTQFEVDASGSISAADLVHVVVALLTSKPYELTSSNRKLPPKPGAGKGDRAAAASHEGAAGATGVATASPVVRRRQTTSPTSENLAQGVQHRLVDPAFGEALWESLQAGSEHTQAGGVAKGRVSFDKFYEIMESAYAENGEASMAPSVLRAEVHALLRLVATNENDIDRLKGAAEKLRFELEARSSSYKANIAQLESAAHQHSQLADEMQKKLESEKHALLLDVSRLQSENVALKARTSDIAASNEQSHADETSLARVNTDIRRKHDVLQSEFNILHQEHKESMDRLESEAHELRAELHAQVEIISSLQTLLKERDAELEQSQATVSAHEGRIEQLAAALQQQTDELDERLRGNYSRRTSTASASTWNTKPLGDELMDVDVFGQPSRPPSSYGSPDSQRDDFDADEIAELKATIASQQAAIAKLQAANRRSRNHNDNEIHALRDELSQQVQSVQRLTDELNQARDRIGRASTENPPAAVSAGPQKSPTKVTVHVKREVITYSRGKGGKSLVHNVAAPVIESQSFFTGPSVDKMKSEPWTPAEDAVLTRTYRQTAPAVAWLDVAKALPGRSDRQCSARWAQLYGSQHGNQYSQSATSGHRLFSTEQISRWGGGISV